MQLSIWFGNYHDHMEQCAAVDNLLANAPKFPQSTKPKINDRQELLIDY